MSKNLSVPEKEFEARSVLDEIAREGARRMLATALAAERDAFLARYADVVDEEGRRQIVGNGHMPPRTILTGAGPLEVEQPRVNDRRQVDPEDKIRLTSEILPPYVRRSKALDELIPWLYLRGISTGDFGNALQALLGADAKGLSPNVVTRLTETWQKEHEEWNRRDLSQEEYVYIWADGVHFNIRLEEDRQCILVVIGATKDGKKELLGVLDGFRECEQSWRELLVNLKSQGLRWEPKLATGDGALGFWKALRKVFSATRAQRCWVHKTANVLSKVPKSIQERVKSDIHEIWMASTRKGAEEAFDTFLEKYGAKYHRAAKCLTKDREELLAFYDFPAEHWKHLRTTNPIESAFSTVRLRHSRTKGNGNRRACLAMVFKLMQAAQRGWRRLDGYKLILELVEGATFKDGIKENAA